MNREEVEIKSLSLDGQEVAALCSAAAIILGLKAHAGTDDQPAWDESYTLLEVVGRKLAGAIGGDWDGIRAQARVLLHDFFEQMEGHG